MFQDKDKFAEEGLTYDDVLLSPAFSDVLPREVSTSTQFTKKHIALLHFVANRHDRPPFQII